MKKSDEDNLLVLHICLAQIYQDFLVRVIEAGEKDSSALGAANAYLNGDYALDFNISMRVNNLDVRCAINEQVVFNANLKLNKTLTH